MNSLRGLLLTALLIPCSVQAGLVTSVGGGTTTTFGGGPDCFSGPSSGSVAGFAISADNDACYNYSDGWGLSGNGSWSMSLIGDNSGSTIITIDLGGLYFSAGGFMNYAPDYGTPVIAALAADGVTVLESYDLSLLAPIDTPGATDEGAFRGISRGSADIRYLQIGGSYTAMHDITLNGGTSGVPEPASVFLAGFALAGLACVRRRAVR
jgi:hypothetical protein